MTRRVRRDLSDKQIRKIVREQFKDFAEPQPDKAKKFPWKIPVIIVLLLIAAGAVYFLGQGLDWNRPFFSDSATADTLRLKGTETPPEQSGAQSKAAEKPGGEEISATAEEENNAVQQDSVKKPTIEPVRQKPQIEVLNGCGASGVAKSVTDYLRARGFDVVYMGNYKNFDVSKTQILGWEDNPKTLRKLADELGIDRRLVTIKPNPNKQLMASVVIGKNYRYTKPFKK
ncbi:MAG: hypothetical protein Kow0037_06620 [Calditrichia bacterium]